MNESISESTSTKDINEFYKESPQNFPVCQWHANSGLSPIPSWPQTFDIIQDYFCGSKEEESHNLGEEVNHSATTPSENLWLSDFNYTDPKNSLVVRVDSTKNKEKLCSVPELKSPLESSSSLAMLPELNSGQKQTDANYNTLEISKRRKSFSDPSKKEETNSSETSSSCAGSPRVLLKQNLNMRLSKFEKTCMKLIPLINRTNTKNYCVLLVATLKTCSQDLTLQELYSLLYNADTCALIKSMQSNESMNDQYKNTLKLEGLKVCSFILDIFSSKTRRVNSIVSEFVNNPLLEAVNFEEIRKKLLAIKILLDCVLIDDSSLRNRAVPRSSLYKAYCMICKTFPERVNLSSKQYKFNRSGFVGAPHFGTLTKLVYPHLKLRRLGRRGSSKHHYVGIVWNKAIVDAEMLKHLESNNPVTLIGNTQHKSQDFPKLASARFPRLSKSDGKRSFFSGFADTKYSFVLLATKLPISDFSPRDWKYSSGKFPQQSDWSSKVMEISSMDLHKYDIYMKPVIQDFYDDIFSSHDSKIFFRKFIQRINILIENNADDEGYFHMYLIILLLIFPVSLASDKEVPREGKVKLRKALNFFVHGLEFEVTNLPISKLKYLQNFSNIIKKMMHMSELSSSHIEAGLVQGTVQEIALDLQNPTASHTNLHENPAIEEFFSRAVFAAANAFEYEFLVENIPKDTPHSTEMLGNIVKAFINCAIKNTEHILGIPRLMSQRELESSTFDLPFQIFKFQTKVLHEICFTDPFISKLSLQVIRYILLMVTNELQNISFGEFGKREPELSKSTFKTWWVLSVLIGEYLKILEEIVALSGRLS